jgi:prepilin-type N-terminal cleavage/methylation domain-containing protein
MNMRAQKQTGFTIVELLIVIVVIAVLAAISIVAYGGIQTRAKNAKLQSALASVQKKIEAYNAEFGSYPATQTVNLVQGAASDVMTRIDSGCSVPSGATVDKRTDWVPDIDMVLPQSTDEIGARGSRGCFMYQSDGKRYVLSAWNMVAGSPQNTTMYRRVGFREMSNQQYFVCNHANIGASNPAPYDESRDMYKRSYTVSNVADCNETAPAGA